MAKNDFENGVWRTVGGRRIFIKDGEDLETAMKKSGKFGKKEIEEKIETKGKTTKELNNRKNLVDYIKWQLDIDLEKAITEKQFSPRKGLNIDSRKLSKNEFNSLKSKLLKEEIRIESNGVYDYFITYPPKKEPLKIEKSKILTTKTADKKDNLNITQAKDFSSMTRKELATLLVEDQIKRGIIKIESKEKQIKARLTGQFKMSHLDLIDYARRYFK